MMNAGFLFLLLLVLLLIGRFVLDLSRFADYPNWVRAVAAVWLISSLILGAVGLFFRPPKRAQPDPQPPPSSVATSYGPQSRAVIQAPGSIYNEAPSAAQTADLVAEKLQPLLRGIADEKAAELRRKFPKGYAIFSISTEGQEIVPLKNESGFPILVKWETGKVGMDEKNIHLTIPDYVDLTTHILIANTTLTLPRVVGASAVPGPAISGGFGVTEPYVEIMEIRPGVVVLVWGMR